MRAGCRYVIKVKITFHSTAIDDGAVKIEVIPDNDLPAALAVRMGEELTTVWEEKLRAPPVRVLSTR